MIRIQIEDSIFEAVKFDSESEPYSAICDLCGSRKKDCKGFIANIKGSRYFYDVCEKCSKKREVC